MGSIDNFYNQVGKGLPRESKKVTFDILREQRDWIEEAHRSARISRADLLNNAITFGSLAILADSVVGRDERDVLYVAPDLVPYPTEYREVTTWEMPVTLKNQRQLDLMYQARYSSDRVIHAGVQLLHLVATKGIVELAVYDDDGERLTQPTNYGKNGERFDLPAPIE